MSKNTPTLGQLIGDALEIRLRNLRVALPGQVLAFDRDTGKARIQPLIDDVVHELQVETDERVVEPLPAINNVPVAFQGSGQHRIRFNLSAGDTGLLVFCSSSLDKWLTRGGRVDPNDDRHHHLSDAVFYPGLVPFNDPESGGVHETALTIDSDGEIHAGGSDALATKADVQKIVDAISSAGVSAGDGGATFKAALVAALAGYPIGTQKLKGS